MAERTTVATKALVGKDLAILALGSIDVSCHSLFDRDVAILATCKGVGTSPKVTLGWLLCGTEPTKVVDNHSAS